MRLRCFTAAYLLMFTSASNWSASRSSLSLPPPGSAALRGIRSSLKLRKTSGLPAVTPQALTSKSTMKRSDSHVLTLVVSRHVAGRTVGGRAVLQPERASGTPSLAVACTVDSTGLDADNTCYVATKAAAVSTKHRGKVMATRRLCGSWCKQ